MITRTIADRMITHIYHLTNSEQLESFGKIIDWLPSGLELDRVGNALNDHKKHIESLKESHRAMP